MTDVLTTGSRAARNRRFQPHYVYQLWDHRHCLYVGVTVDVGKRLSTHARKEWWQDVKRIEVHAFPDRELGLTAEKDLIEELDPIQNRLGVL
jgi:predicted GIY-YIG superfamily endonuclease